MDPAPMCKTAILRFLVDKKTVPKLWNLSSNMRKRLQMVLEEIDIILKKYNEKALRIKEWLRIGQRPRLIESVDDIKKGVANYYLKTREQLDRVVSLNGKLRCFSFEFTPNSPLEFDYIEDISISFDSYCLYSNCSFSKISFLCLKQLSSDQIKEIIARVKEIKNLKIEESSVSDLDLTSVNVRSVDFYSVTFLGKAKMPFYLDCLNVDFCRNSNLLECNQIGKLKVSRNFSDNPYDFIKSIKGLKEVDLNVSVENFANNVPNTIRIVKSLDLFYLSAINFSTMREKFPYLIKITRSVLIKTAQALNLRSIEPVMTETEEKFTLRPREMIVHKYNVDQLNKHPELFEKVDKLDVRTDRFDYDCLPSRIKEIRICYRSSIEGEKMESLKKNSWKFENSLVHLSDLKGKDQRRIMSCFNKVKVKFQIN